MICRPDNIRLIRPIADNIMDFNRIIPYIDEAERLDVMPYIGVDLYRQIDEAILKDNQNIPIKNNIGNIITVTFGDWKNILCGTYYHDCACQKWHGGLIKAISYLAYSRCLMQHQINVTAFGVVFKESQFSTPIDEKTLVRASNKAEKIGLEYLRQVRDYLRSLCLLDGCVQQPKRKDRFKIIGN